jgi:purine-binding chemotaxis protein CheW
MEGGEGFVAFELDGEQYALPMAAVGEVLRVPDAVTRLPRAPDFVVGMINLRGEVLPIIDLRRQFDLPPGVEDPRRRILVLDFDGMRTGFLVDTVSRLFRLTEEAICSSPAPGDDLVGTVTRVATFEDGGLLPLIDPRTLLERARSGMSQAMRASARVPAQRRPARPAETEPAA